VTNAIGPVELVILGFEENRFTGDIAATLMDLIDRGLVRIIDLVVVIKDRSGVTTVLELSEYSPELTQAMVALTGDVVGLLSEEDIHDIVEMLDPNSTAAVLLFEHLWATEFATAVRSAGGELILSQRVPTELVEATQDTLIAAAAALG
jgi:uncharacterized membrane protein